MSRITRTTLLVVSIMTLPCLLIAIRSASADTPELQSLRAENAKLRADAAYSRVVLQPGAETLQRLRLACEARINEMYRSPACATADEVAHHRR
jgi:hypothetical protein